MVVTNSRALAPPDHTPSLTPPTWVCAFPLLMGNMNRQKASTPHWREACFSRKASRKRAPYEHLSTQINLNTTHPSPRRALGRRLWSFQLTWTYFVFAFLVAMGTSLLAVHHSAYRVSTLFLALSSSRAGSFALSATTRPSCLLVPCHVTPPIPRRAAVWPPAMHIPSVDLTATMHIAAGRLNNAIRAP